MDFSTLYSDAIVVFERANKIDFYTRTNNYTSWYDITGSNDIKYKYTVPAFINYFN